jgi:biopolymer transport protein ExbD
MVMSIGPTSGIDDPEMMMDINTTPLIDVMLVLLVMLIITIPIQLHAVNMDLPVGTPPASLSKPQNIEIDIDSKSAMRWQGDLVNSVELETRMHALAQLPVQPTIHIKPHKKSSYATFAHVLATSKRQGLEKMAVIGSEQYAAGGKSQ